MSTRGFWPMRDLPLVGWLVLATLASLTHPFLPAPRWLLIHLVVLGAMGHAILVWSRYFADTLLRLPPSARSTQNLRLAGFNLGVLAVVTGVLTTRWPITLAGATVVGAAALWHGATLAVQLRGKLAGRFSGTIRYYVSAAALLPIGAGLGAWLARDLAAPWHDRARMAHVAINVLGWLGLTVLGTLVTLWPTMLRTRLATGAERAAARALPLLLGGITVTAATALLGWPLGVGGGLALYLTGVGILLVPAVRTARTKPPTSFPAWSVLCGVTWLVGSLGWLLLTVPLSGSWQRVDQRLATVTPVLVAGFALQVLLGALSYLIPVVLGGGPSAVRAANQAFDRAGPWRLAVTNLGLLLTALPTPSLVRVATSTLALIGLGSFLPLLFTAMRASRRARNSAPSPTAPGGPRPKPDGDRPSGQRVGLLAAGVATVLLTVAGAAALDPTALRLDPASASAGIAPTGRTTHVQVVAREMRFHPASVSVPAGDRLVLTVRNESAGDVHDLVLETGAQTGRIAPGHSARLDAGVVGRTLDGWCSVVGHRQMGMVFEVKVTGGSTAQPTDHTPAPDAHQHHAGTGGGATATLDPMAEPADSFVARDATLGSPPPRRWHRHTFEVTEGSHEVAPGVRQELWTYNGTAPGPVLHGRVGDVFEVTLVNRGSMGHSVDFHASNLAPDRPMRTLAPGESLVYRFTANRAGIWMYHCASMPMSAHVANGLFGAVVIDPPDLPRADRSYVLVGSELYLGKQGGTVDVDKLAQGRPDGVVFNGYVGQYTHRPLPARVGERVRIWVLDAGPDRPLSFHVVGGQFDRVWTEGAYTLGGAAAPARDTGAQVLPLLPAQGGFVELTFPEPGRYPFLNHVMSDAERGAQGAFLVTR